ncbi:hypothetical protein FRC17_003244 [Serendipita sp. 399]|nr:hypothetical protein FRC17_003244 [Serendipita sp. 399]
MVSILQLAKRCKENREGWEKLAIVIQEKNESITALIQLYAKAPSQYPSAQRHASEYQRYAVNKFLWIVLNSSRSILDSIATDIKNETQKKSEASQKLELYWSRIQSAGREAVLASINAEKIVAYQDQLRNITFDVIEKTVIGSALATSHALDKTSQALQNTSQALQNMRATLKESSKSNTKAILKPRPRVVESFVGREDILASMFETHFGNDASSTRRDGPIVTVLAAMGGSGKTQIAVKFASMFEERFPEPPVFFVDGTSEAALKADLDTLVRSQTDSYDDALVWLANGVENWLLIIDNADDPSLKLSLFLPRAPQGHVIITTRDATRRLLAPRSTHIVDVLSIDDSITLLLMSSSCEDNETNRSFARDIVEELGRLPLALAHAASYILINDCLDTFLKTYSESRRKLLQRTPDLDQGYRYSVEGTIEMSFHRLSPRVQEMMQLFTYLDARSIARCIIERAADRGFLHIPYGSRLPPNSATVQQAEILQSIFCLGGKWSAFNFDEMVGECLQYSLLRLSTADGERFYSMHPLVQMYLQSISNSLRDCSVRKLVVRLLASATDAGDLYQFFTFNRLLSPHVLLVHLEDVGEAGDHFGFGSVLLDLGHLPAISHTEHCVDMWRSSIGENAEYTLEALHQLAISYKAVRRHIDALPLEESLLEKRRELLGPDHLGTLRTMVNLANTYNSLGRQTDALPLEEEVLQKFRKILGPEHLGTLVAMNNLASIFNLLGRHQDALPLAEEVLEKRQKMLGHDHLSTLMTMNNLALIYLSLGRHKDALPLAKEVLEKRQKMLGPDHLDTLTAMTTLANIYNSLGRHKDALPLAAELLEKRRKMLGPDHLDTLRAMNTLASTYLQVGRPEEAIPLYKKVLDKYKKLLGPERRETADVMFNLLLPLKTLGEDEELKKLARIALPLHEKVYGSDHIKTAWIKSLLD